MCEQTGILIYEELRFQAYDACHFRPVIVTHNSLYSQFPHLNQTLQKDQTPE